jgi:hypothetical protein
MKRTHKIGLTLTDDAYGLLAEKSSGALAPTTVATMLLEAAVDAIRRSGKFSIPLRFEVTEDAAKPKKAA